MYLMQYINLLNHPNFSHIQEHRRSSSCNNIKFLNNNFSKTPFVLSTHSIFLSLHISGHVFCLFYPLHRMNSISSLLTPSIPYSYRPLLPSLPHAPTHKKKSSLVPHSIIPSEAIPGQLFHVASYLSLSTFFFSMNCTMANINVDMSRYQ